MVAAIAGAAFGANLMSARPAAAQVVVMVNGLPITSLDIQQRERLERISGGKAVSRDQALKALIDDKLKITIAKRYGLDLSEAEVQQSFNQIAGRTRQSPEQFTQALNRAGVSANTLKDRIRADVLWNQLIRGKFSSSLNVSDGELAGMMRDNNAKEQDETGYIYTLRPIMVVVPQGSSPAVVDSKRREAEAIRARFQDCTRGVAMARGLRDVAVREPVRRSSADLPEQLRNILAKLEVGQVSTPDATPQGLEMFALCEKKSTKTETAEKRQLKEKMFNERFDKEAKKFLEETRRSAIIEYRR
ncbi:MAG: SurA N-terminal domain-containing protein [Pseudolabrys sp.]